MRIGIDLGGTKTEALLIDKEGNKVFSKRIPICGVLGGGYNKDFNKLVELHSILHQSCA